VALDGLFKGRHDRCGDVRSVEVDDLGRVRGDQLVTVVENDEYVRAAGRTGAASVADGAEPSAEVEIG
jgi:hypothetical protein